MGPRMVQLEIPRIPMSKPMPLPWSSFQLRSTSTMWKETKHLDQSNWGQLALSNSILRNSATVFVNYPCFTFPQSGQCWLKLCRLMKKKVTVPQTAQEPRALERVPRWGLVYSKTLVEQQHIFFVNLFCDYAVRWFKLRLIKASPIPYWHHAVWQSKTTSNKKACKQTTNRDT